MCVLLTQHPETSLFLARKLYIIIQLIFFFFLFNTHTHTHQLSIDTKIKLEIVFVPRFNIKRESEPNRDQSFRSGEYTMELIFHGLVPAVTAVWMRTEVWHTYVSLHLYGPSPLKRRIKSCVKKGVNEPPSIYRYWWCWEAPKRKIVVLWSALKLFGNIKKEFKF